MPSISAAAARRLIVHCQGLDGAWSLPPGAEGAADAIGRLGQVQIDSINVVQRAHHHMLWTRYPGYAPEMLDMLQAERRVFEQWSRDSTACYFPIDEYRFYLPLMEQRARYSRTASWLAENATLAREVLCRVRDEGPLRAADFDPPPGWEGGQWWHWKPAKLALEMLFATGELLVSGRRGFQRLYDLAERVLPPDVERTAPDREEFARFVVRRDLGRLGLATHTDLTRWRMRPWAEDVRQAIADLTASGEVTPVEVEGAKKRDLVALTRRLRSAEEAPEPDKTLHILSPFDAVMHRRSLFGVEYKLECYVPAAKRLYGYFCLPLLWGTEFVGRLDAKAERKQRRLLVRHLYLEPGTSDSDALLPALAAKLWGFAAFNGCEAVAVEHAEPHAMGRALQRELGLGIVG